jgi:hypothetical protein
MGRGIRIPTKPRSHLAFASLGTSRRIATKVATYQVLAWGFLIWGGLSEKESLRGDGDHPLAARPQFELN